MLPLPTKQVMDPAIATLKIDTDVVTAWRISFDGIPTQGNVLFPLFKKRHPSP